MALRLDPRAGAEEGGAGGGDGAAGAGKPDAYELRADDLFYVGEDDDRRASLRASGEAVRRGAFDTSRPGTWLTVLPPSGGSRACRSRSSRWGVGAIAALAERSGTAAGASATPSGG